MKAALVTLAIAGIACGNSAAGSADGGAQDGGQQDAGPQKVELTEVVSHLLDRKVPLQGELTPYEAVDLHARLPAFVDSVLVDRGSRVKRGQLLVELSAPELLAQRTEAQAKLAGEKSTVERLERAAKTPGVVAGHEVELARAALQGDESRVRALRAQEAYLQLTAPFDGVVTDRWVHPGALVGPGAPALLRVVQNERLRLAVAVPETETGAISEGVQTEFHVRAWPGQTFHGAIRRIAREVGEHTRTMAVELDVDNRDGRLAPGMFAEVLWPSRRTEPSLFVPASAVVQTPEALFVDRVQDGTVERIPVERGAALPDQQEVFGGLHAGDQVMLRGSEVLANGARVQPIPRKPAVAQPK
jgi:membrane fusion protein, multidrug efflux system